MKRQSNILFRKFSKNSLVDLTKEVKETLAPGFKLPDQKSFTAAGLWDIRRHAKYMVQRRFIF